MAFHYYHTFRHVCAILRKFIDTIFETYWYIIDYMCNLCKKNQLDAQLFFLYLFIPFFYMFRATKCSSLGESIVSIRPLVHVTVCR